MTRPSDETLMAYADGALPEAERIAIEAYLAQDEDARRIVEAFRRSTTLARAAFDEALAAPPPADLVARILAAPPDGTAAPLTAPAADAAGARVIPMPPAGRRRTAMPTRFALPLAASIALAVGLTAGLLAGRTPSPDAAALVLGPVGPGTTLARVLDTTPSGARSERVDVVATFRDRHGRVCREFEVVHGPSGDARPQAAAVACRSALGTWTIEGAAQIAVAPKAGSGFEPSGASERDALQGLLDILGAGAALPPKDERALIERGWR